MNLSFTLDEKIFSELSAKDLIEKTSNLGVSSFELSPDTSILEKKEYEDLVKIISSNDLELNYHVPYFADDIYGLEYFSIYEGRVKDKYMEFLNLLEDFQNDLTNEPIIVVHGSNYIHGNEKQAVDITLKFLDWMLNTIAKKNLPFTLAVETLRRKETRNTFDSRANLAFVLDAFKSEKLKICWDLCHDKLNFHHREVPIDDNFLKQVVYAHIHGHKTKEDISHISLAKSDIDFTRELEALKASGFKGDINIELLSQFTNGTYLDDLFKDIEYIKKFL